MFIFTNGSRTEFAISSVDGRTLEHEMFDDYEQGEEVRRSEERSELSHAALYNTLTLPTPGCRAFVA